MILDTADIQTQSYPTQILKTSYNTMQKLVATGTLQPNSVVRTVRVSRNVPQAELIDGVVEYWLPGDSGHVERYFLYSISGTTTDWILVLVSKPDDNEPVPQTHTVLTS